MNLLDKILISFLAFIYGILPGILMDNYVVAVAGGAVNVYLTTRAMKWLERVAKKIERLINTFT